jgi:NAD(P)-dependent dehydrogenase (short-subunit alcohol dehydrogenase family)
MQTILITGANRGIGLEFTRRYAGDGLTVHACCRNPAQATDLQALAKETDGRVVVHALDVTDGASVADLAGELGDTPLDMIINNAGIYGPREGSQFGQIEYDAWPEVMTVNVMGPMRVAEALAANLAKGKEKLLVTISSRMGSMAENTSGGAYIYRSSKAAVNAVVKSLSVDLAPLRITAVAFHPGWVRTDMGGSGAAISAEESVAGMRAAIAKLEPADNGTFWNYDGSPMPW